MEFVARQAELKLLDSLYQRPGAQLLILTGRRRIGKTRLMTHWLTRRPGEALSEGHTLYWLATQTSAANQLRDFSSAVHSFINPDAAIDPAFSYPSWDVALAEVGRAAQKERIVLILDEFSYVLQADPEAAGGVQTAWDRQLKEGSNLFLILSGSLTKVMERAIFNQRGALYGRPTGTIHLDPLPFGALSRLLKRYQASQRVAVYAMMGGVPAYIALFDDQAPVLENLGRRLAIPACTLVTDASYLLYEQLGEPRNYMAILEAIAAGCHSLSAVAASSGISRANIVKYLKVLQELGYVERRVPATVQRPDQSRLGHYVILDPYLRFTYRFLVPDPGLVERGLIEEVIDLVAAGLDPLITAYTFPELCRDWVTAQADMGALPFLPERVGSHWSRHDNIDVVAVNWDTKDILLGACQWNGGPVKPDTMSDLLEKASLLDLQGEAWTAHHIFFARHGFTPAAQEVATTHQVRLVTLPQLDMDLQHWASGNGQIG